MCIAVQIGMDSWLLELSGGGTVASQRLIRSGLPQPDLHHVTGWNTRN